ncbi:MAG: hypothetical protein LBG10_02600 [Treponema sp.]|jgi:hypothetical protein|nr:hypothetical protein [Treponema sp.]
MGLFIQEGKLKSALLLLAFSLSLLYIGVYGLAYALTADLVSRLVPLEAANFLQKWLPPSLICIAASILCGAPLLFVKDRRVVLGAFALLGFYAVLTATGVVLAFDGEKRIVLLVFTVLYLGFPALWGNGIAWIINALAGRKNSDRRDPPEVH